MEKGLWRAGRGRGDAARDTSDEVVATFRPSPASVGPMGTIEVALLYEEETRRLMFPRIEKGSSNWTDDSIREYASAVGAINDLARSGELRPISRGITLNFERDGWTLSLTKRRVALDA